MKYTPGPWRIGHWQDNGHAIYSEKPVGIIIRGGVSEANAHLIAAVPDLLEEHKHWAKILGHIIVGALQKDYETLETYMRYMKIVYKDGEPVAYSEAIAKAEEGD